MLTLINICTVICILGTITLGLVMAALGCTGVFMILIFLKVVLQNIVFDCTGKWRPIWR